MVFTTTTTKMPSLSAVSASSFSSFSSSSSELQKRIKKNTNVSRGRRGGARGLRGGRFHRTTKAESNTNNDDYSVKIEREGLERREPRRRGPRRKIARVVVNKEEEEEDKEEDEEASKRLVREEGKTNTKTTKNTKKKTSMTMTERWQKDPLSALISIPRIALGAAEELIVEKGGNPSDVLEEIGRNVPRLVSSSPFSSSSNNTNDGDDDTESVENILRDLEREMERLERKGADAARPMREALVKPNVDEETYERYFAYPSSKGEGEEDDEDEDEDEDEEGGFYDASKDTGSDEEVAKAASDIADALSGMDLADLYAEKKEEKGRSKSEEGERGRRLNVIAESNSRKAEKNGVSPEAVEYTIEENLSNVVMETATVSSTRRRVVSSAASSSTTPATTIEISNKYYSSAAISPEERKEEEKEKTTVVSIKDTSSYVQKFNGKWKRDDQLDESKLMDLFEMNRLFRAANSALTQLDVGATTSNFSLIASYGIISVNESYAYDSEVRQNRRDARSGAQFGRATLDAQSESITLESRWTEPLEGNMTETFEVDENDRLLRKAKVTLLNTNKTWEGVYEYKRV